LRELRTLEEGRYEAPLGNSVFPYLRCMAYALSTLLAMRGSYLVCYYCSQMVVWMVLEGDIAKGSDGGSIKRNVSGERDQQLGTESRK